MYFFDRIQFGQLLPVVGSGRYKFLFNTIFSYIISGQIQLIVRLSITSTWLQDGIGKVRLTQGSLYIIHSRAVAIGAAGAAIAAPILRT